MENIKVSVAMTVLNEEKSIAPLLESILSQTEKPDEVIIVDGGSRDRTVAQIKNSKLKIQKGKSKFKIYIKRGYNRAQGKNYAIKKAKNEIIAITDAGVILDKNWVKNITGPFKNKSVEIVSGYYKIDASTIFEKCVGVYVLVMPDKVSSKTFLPSSRSMALKKSTWREAGGFPEEFPLNDDYVFAHTLKRLKKNFYFARDAICYWKPRQNIVSAFLMFYFFALGDSQARIFRPKVGFIFLRYIIGFVILIVNMPIFSFLFTLYILWAIIKNYKYVKSWQAIFFLPILQLTSDIAVMGGSLYGLYERHG